MLTRGKLGTELHTADSVTLGQMAQFAPEPDADTLAYEFTVENPSVFTRTFSARFPMTRSDLPLYEYACHEGNYGLYNILNGARSEERGAATR